MSQEKIEFVRSISDGLAKNPEWLGEALLAVTHGMERAIRDLKEQRAQYDLAFRSALSLASPDRLTRGSKLLLNGAIVNAIHEAGMSPIEREWLKLARERAERGEDAG